MCLFLTLILVLLSTSSTVGQDVRTLPIIPQVSLTEQEIKWVEDNPIITATNNVNFTPFDFVRNGMPMGFAIDYLNLVAEKVGLEVHYYPNEDWRNLVDQVEKGEIDVMHSIIDNAERSEHLNFSSPYIRLPVLSFGQSGSAPIYDRAGLEGKRLGVIRGWSGLEAVNENYPELEIIEFDNMDGIINSISTGNIDMVQSTPYSIRHRLAQNFVQNIESFDNNFVFHGENYREHRFAVNKESSILMSILEKGMSGISKTEYDAIGRRWLEGYQQKNTVDLNEEELAWLSENRTVKVVAEPDLAPLIFRGENGAARGISVDFLKIVEERLGIEFEWVLKDTFAEVISNLETGKADIIPAINATEERKRQFLLTDPMIDGSQMIFARSGSPIYGSIDALSDKKLVQVRGYSVTAELNKNYPDLDIVEVDNLPEALRYITSGRADAFISDILVTTYYISRERLANVVVVGETDIGGDVSVAIRSDAPILASIIDKSLKTLTDVEKAEIQGKWLSIDIRSSVDYSKIWQVVIISAIILAIILFWNNLLLREIRNRKVIQKKLVIAQRKAKAESEAKSNFLANMSHEIRTPLNAIVGFSEAMKMGIHGEIKEPKYQSYLDDISGSGKHLTTVINDILDLSKIEAGKMKLTEENFILDDCVTEAVQMNRIHANNKNIVLNYNCCEDGQVVKVVGDNHAIKRAIVNLISNAIKYTPDEGSVWCHRYVTEQGDIIIEIKDDGIGIPENRISAVVKPFEQGNLTHELNDEGTGLGLPIVKNLVELHGGTFELSSVFGKGTTASIILPAERVLENIPMTATR